jgi:hypothetical protein
MKAKFSTPAFPMVQVTVNPNCQSHRDETAHNRLKRAVEHAIPIQTHSLSLIDSIQKHADSTKNKQREFLRLSHHSSDFLRLVKK